MDTKAKIDHLIEKLQQSGRDTHKSILYAEGVKAKLRQAEYSLEILRDLVHLEDSDSGQSGATGPMVLDSLTVSEKVNFYCDCFWDFLRSSLDILGQLINEVSALGIGERNVDLKQVVNRVNSVAAGGQLDRALDKLCYHCRAFKQLEDYRHCSTHRRHIYIETRTVTEVITGSTGYYAGTSANTPTSMTERYLCTNAWDANPTINGGRRPVVQYCEWLLKQIEVNIEKIVYHLL